MNEPNNIGLTPLHLAAMKGQKEIVKALIDAEANVNAQDNGGWTPLSWADINCHTEVVKILEDAQITK